MMDVVLYSIELKPDAMANVDAWKTELTARKAEVIETLQAEGVLLNHGFT